MWSSYQAPAGMLLSFDPALTSSTVTALNEVRVTARAERSAISEGTVGKGEQPRNATLTLRGKF
ncbi:hypothetical protein [Xylophilus sp. ASV27]|uniref:hypothetical protein n=1 Tax=Xylophilus sp. ASV27 TaxID=2795129 RepID=UPI0018EB55FD|nr:hypothetical protein [Xylophilus sp. ASV27]